MIDYDFLVVGEKEEVINFKREIIFDDDELEILYNNLPVYFQNVITNTILKLKNNDEYLGYNFNQVTEWFSKSNVASSFTANFVYNNVNFDKKDTDYEYFDLSKAVNRIKNKITVKPGKNNDNITYNLLKGICDYWMISPELIFNGEGEIFTVCFENFSSEDFEKFCDFINEEEGGCYQESLTTKEFYKKFQEYLKDKYPNHKDIILIEYAKIKKDGIYCMFKDFPKKYGHYKDTIDNLIKELYAIDKVIAPRL